MAFSRSILRHTMLWSLPGSEVASTGCHWAEATSIVSWQDTYGSLLDDKAQNLWDAIQGNVNTNVFFLGSRVAWLAADGHTVETHDYPVTADAGGAGASSLPTEVSVCVSLRTSFYGRSGRGRMYLPPYASDVLTATGRFAAASATALATAMAAYCSSDTDTGLSSVVASATTGAVRDVTEVQVGDVFDAQRRRRDSLVEVRYPHAVS